MNHEREKAVRNILRVEEGLGKPPLTGLVIERGLQGATIGAVAGALFGVYLQSESGVNLVWLSTLVVAEVGASPAESRRSRNSAGSDGA